MADALTFSEKPEAGDLVMLTGWRQWADAGSISSYGVFNEQIQITAQAVPPGAGGVILPSSYNYLANALASTEVLTKKDPLRIWTFDQMPYAAGTSALQPFGIDFDIDAGRGEGRSDAPQVDAGAATHGATGAGELRRHLLEREFLGGIARGGEHPILVSDFLGFLFPKFRCTLLELAHGVLCGLIARYPGCEGCPASGARVRMPS